MLFQRAFAKINLGLRILGKRPDGYHDIETVFHRVDVHDDLAVEASGSLRLECDTPEIPIEGNLVLAAAEALRRRYGVNSGASFTLTKRIPHGAGLGGGSADAASALRLLCRLWNIDADPAVLSEIALMIGSDVPYFLGEGSAHATGRGEKLAYFPLALRCPVLVVSPELQVSTPKAYASVVPGNYAGSDDLRTLLLQHIDRPDLLGDVLVNDFERSVLSAYPEIGRLKQLIYGQGADFCLLSGSGSSVFALFPDEPTARSAASTLSGEHRVFLTRPGFVPDLRIEGDPD